MRVVAGDSPVSGRFIDLDDDGAMVLDDGAGGHIRVTTGDVELLGQASLMILAIDVGNTNLVLALGDEAGSVDLVWRISSDAVTSADACRDAVRKTLGTKLEEIDNSVIASVVPAITRHVATAMEDITGRAPLVIGEDGVDLGIAVNIDRPEQAGADRSSMRSGRRFITGCRP